MHRLFKGSQTHIYSSQQLSSTTVQINAAFPITPAPIAVNLVLIAVDSYA
jgi:hypothetical protein